MTQRARRIAVPALGALLSCAAAAWAGAGAAPSTAERLDPPRRTITVLAGGDVLAEERVRASAASFGQRSGARFDFTPLFGPVAEVVSWADLAICHMELPIGAPGVRPGYYGRSPYGGSLLLAPHELAEGARSTGFDRCSTASNHSNDLGLPGIASTLDALDAAGITHVGTARTPAEAVDRPFVVAGVRVAHLSYTRSSNTVRPASWAMNYAASVDEIIRDVASVRSAGAELVIVSVHLGTELQTGPTPGDRSFATTLVARADIDLLVHHGPHVVQPVEWIGGVPVYWSLGNFVSEMGEPGGSGRYREARTSDGLLAAVRFTDDGRSGWRIDAGSVVICNEFGARIVRAPGVSLADPALTAAQRAQLESCAARVRALVPDAR